MGGAAWTWSIARCELAVQLRRPMLLSGLALLALGSIVLLQLAIAGSGRVDPIVGAGATWVVLLLGIVTVLGSSIGQDTDQGTWDALLASGASRAQVAFGKLAGMLVLVLTLHLFVLPLAWGLLAAPTSPSQALVVALAVLLADLGACAVAVLAGMVTMHARSRELLGPVLLVPLTLPVLIVGVSISAHATDPTFAASPPALLAFLALYDLVFLVALWGLSDELAVR